uniref:Secreted protein n=1 Tax=Rhipicephalus microplus TaxID=6941 RepID=A0A6G5A1D3_RHIMP
MFIPIPIILNLLLLAASVYKLEGMKAVASLECPAIPKMLMHGHITVLCHGCVFGQTWCTHASAISHHICHSSGQMYCAHHFLSFRQVGL